LDYKTGRIKLEVGLAKGKKQHDKRNDEQEKDWKREKEQILKEKQR
jgi:SsrA-binding protein